MVDANQNLLAGETYFNGRYLGTQTPGAFVYAHADELGTVRARTNTAGALSETDLSGPWGEPTNLQNGTSQIHFAGQLFDPETNLSYFGARYYQASTGRFLTPDWSEAPEPVPYASLENPQSLNLYSYVLNNPVTSLDRDGHVRTDDSSDLAAWAPMDEGSTMESLFGDEFGFDALASIDAQHAERDALLAAIAGIPMSVRENVGDSVADSNAPDADDTRGDFHEEGGLWGTNDAGGTVTQRAVAGAYSDPDTATKAEINLFNFRDPDHATITTVAGSWHVHPKGVTASGNGFVQEPSDKDERNGPAILSGKLNFVVSARSEKVYFFTPSGVTRTIGLQKFLGGGN